MHVRNVPKPQPPPPTDHSSDIWRSLPHLSVVVTSLLSCLVATFLFYYEFINYPVLLAHVQIADIDVFILTHNNIVNI